jgi:hypothetical protein
MLYFHPLVVPAGLACLWIPAFAGMTVEESRWQVGGLLGKSPAVGGESFHSLVAPSVPAWSTSQKLKVNVPPP